MGRTTIISGTPEVGSGVGRPIEFLNQNRKSYHNIIALSNIIVIFME